MDDILTGLGFSIEMKTMEHVRTVSLSEAGYEGSFFKDILRELEEFGVLEEAIPMVRGAHGTLRIDKKEKGLSCAMSKDKAATEGS
jgi:hypothetical protein